MPELPEVQIVVNGLNSKIVGKTIAGFSSNDLKVSKLSTADKKNLKAKVKQIRRIGKGVIIDLSNDRSLIIHLKMTGQLVFVDKRGTRYEGGHPEKSYETDLPTKYTRAEFTFADKTMLYFNDLRRFGWIKLTGTKEVENDAFIKTVGPDPLSTGFDKSAFAKKVKSRTTAVYNIITDQKIISGVGNIYANEALWESKISPFTPAGKLTETQIQLLLTNIQKVLKKAITAGGTSYNTFVNVEGTKGGFFKQLKVYKHEGDACPRHDEGTITRKKIGGRSVFFCPVCQR